MELSITGLSFRTTIDDVYRAFSLFGELTDCRLLLNERLESRGFGFISYRRREDAENAIKFMNGHNFDGYQINVQDAKSVLKQSILPLLDNSESESLARKSSPSNIKNDYRFNDNIRRYDDRRMNYDDRYHNERFYERQRDFHRNDYQDMRNYDDRRGMDRYYYNRNNRY